VKELQLGALVPSSGSCQGLHVFSLANPPPNPKHKLQVDHPDIQFWHEGDYRLCVNKAKKAKRGETNGEARSAERKGKHGRPPKSSTQDAEDHSKHFYLENDDGTPVSRELIADLSEKARMVWEELYVTKLTPQTFCKMSKITWDFYWCSIVTIPDLDFLLLCEGGEWKLRQWSIDSYSSWALNRGVQTAKTKVEELDESMLIKMDPNNNRGRRGRASTGLDG
jgi:hypothetical protein